jgi:hypothetical protein
LSSFNCNRKILGKIIESQIETSIVLFGFPLIVNSFDQCCNVAQSFVQVVSVLDPNLKVKSNLIKFVLKRQLAEYGIMFGDSEDGAWLDKVGSPPPQAHFFKSYFQS